MTRPSRRPLLAGAAIALTALAGPALAAGTGVSTQLSAALPTRTFAVLDMAGKPLTAIDLGRGGAMPFQTVVTDSSLTGAYAGFEVQATMSNLYLKNTAGYDYANQIPSKDASLLFPLSPLGASGVTYTVVPRINVTVPLGITCTRSAGLQSALGITLLNSSLPVLTAVQQALCDAFAAAAGGSTVAQAVPQVTTVTDTATAATNGLDGLPLSLTSAAGGTSTPFTYADYGAATVGAGDPAKPSGWSATVVPVMSGSWAGTAFLTSLGKAVSGLSGLPLASANGSGAMTSVQNVLNALIASNSALQTLGSQLATVTSTTTQLALINLLAGAPQSLAAGDVVGIGGQYRTTPVLRVIPGTAPPASGQYEGTLTVTYIQK